MSALIIMASDWALPFQIMCDSSGLSFDAVLGKRKAKLFHTIYYASKLLNNAQYNYTVMKQELQVVIYAFKKFYNYLLGNKVVLHMNHEALCFLMANKR